MLSEIVTMTDSELGDLLQASNFWLRTSSSADIQKMASEIYRCFDGWKQTKIGADGSVASYGSNTLRALLHPSGIRSPSTEVEAWHCVGPHVANEVDLAFHLWLDSYAPFDDLLRDIGITKAFSVCGRLICLKKRASVRSLLRLNGFLVRHLTMFANATGELAMRNLDAAERQTKQLSGLKIARAHSAKIRREKAVERDKNIRRMAVDFFRNKPGAGVKEATLHIQKYETLSSSYIQRTIRGAKTDALRSLHTDTLG